MSDNKEIFITIDESGVLNEAPSKISNQNYYFLTCSFIANKNENSSINKEFHYKKYVFNLEIPLEQKKQTLIDISTKINKMNVFYSICRIDKSKLTDENYRSESISIIKEHFLNLLHKLTKNNNLNININYDAGQSMVSVALQLAIKDFKKEKINNIKMLFDKSNNIGFSDFIVSIEKVKIKMETNTLGIIENELYKDRGLLNVINSNISNKNIDNLQFDNFEELLFPKNDDIISTHDDTDDPPDIP